MTYYITWSKVQGKNGLICYACLRERVDVSGVANSKYFAYLGKEPVAAVEKLYRERKLTLEQVLSIIDKRLPELKELKVKLKEEAQKRDSGKTGRNGEKG
jgi:hypothetical protein